MSTSKLQRKTSDTLSLNFGGYTIRENIRPEWLITKTGSRLELDFYIEELGAAIEVQGAQHYTFVEVFHENYAGFESQIERDKCKRAMCDQAGIKLFEVSDERDLVDAIANIIQLIPIDKPCLDKFASFPPPKKPAPYGRGTRKISRKNPQVRKTIDNLQKEMSKSFPNPDRVKRLRNTLKRVRA
jgi:hypothetical protein